MKSNELRIGNWVNEKTHTTTLEYIDIPVIVKRIEIDFVENNYKPITLNEDWLLKFGFECDIISHFNIWNFQGLKHLRFDVIAGIFIIKETFSVYEVYYVHQLQNLFFALTGEELTIKTK